MIGLLRFSSRRYDTAHLRHNLSHIDGKMGEVQSELVLGLGVQRGSLLGKRRGVAVLERVGEVLEREGDIEAFLGFWLSKNSRDLLRYHGREGSAFRITGVVAIVKA
jgi:hypothetical protein